MEITYYLGLSSLIYLKNLTTDSKLIRKKAILKNNKGHKEVAEDQSKAFSSFIEIKRYTSARKTRTPSLKELKEKSK